MNIRYFDAHCDTLTHLDTQNSSLANNALFIDFERGRTYDAYAQFFAVFAVERECGDSFEKNRNKLLREIEKNADAVSFCRSASDAETAADSGKIAAFISAEGAEVFGCTPEGLNQAYNMGLSMVSLTWNYENVLSGSAAEGDDKGITPLGKEFFRECERLGVIVDVSHLSHKGFWDIAEMANKPFIASHSNSSAVFQHHRGLTDDQLRAIAAHGGVAGLNLYTDFIGSSDTDAILRHADHYVSVAGEKCVCFGADLDGCNSLPDGISGVQDIAKIYDAMIKYGFGNELTDRIFWVNLMEVVRKICDM